MFISPIQRPHYITSSYTYQFFEKNIFCIVIVEDKLHSAIWEPAFIALICIIFRVKDC